MKLSGTTNSEIYGPAMEIRDQAEADDYFEQIVNRLVVDFNQDRGEAEATTRSNLGYWAGYYDRETQERVNRLYRTTHPIFGDTRPTPEEAFRKGVEIGEKMRALKGLAEEEG